MFIISWARRDKVHIFIKHASSTTYINSGCFEETARIVDVTNKQLDVRYGRDVIDQTRHLLGNVLDEDERLDGSVTRKRHIAGLL